MSKMSEHILINFNNKFIMTFFTTLITCILKILKINLNSFKILEYFFKYCDFYTLKFGFPENVDFCRKTICSLKYENFSLKIAVL